MTRSSKLFAGPAHHTAAVLAGLFAVLVGALALLGWALDIAAFKSVLPGMVTMKVNTAIGFILAGGALDLLATAPANPQRFNIARICACIIVAVGALTLTQDLLSLDFGIDQWLFTEILPEGGAGTPGRMAPATAVNFILIGSSLLLCAAAADHRRDLAQWPALFAGFISLLAVVGYVYGASPLYKISIYTGMALHTALTFIVLSAGLLLLRPDRGLIGIVSSAQLGSRVSRRLLPAVFMLPLALGWLRLQGEYAGLYGLEFGLAIFAVANVVVLAVLVLWTSVSLNRTEARRRQSEGALKKLEWMLSKKPADATVNSTGRADQPYGDLAALNTDRTILDAVGKDLLHDIVADFLNLLGTSSAVYEKNGDYAHGVFSSGWCHALDLASFRGCGTADIPTALACGKWHCHESCWNGASRKSMQLRQAHDIECQGGIRLYAVPILAGEEIVGSINFGYGDPPRDSDRLRGLAQKYGLPLEELQRNAAAYEHRPHYIIELAKARLHSAARLIGEIVQRKRAQEVLHVANALLDQRITERTALAAIAVNELTGNANGVLRDLHFSRDADAGAGVIAAGAFLDDVLNRAYDSFHTVIPYDRMGCSLLSADEQYVTARWVRSEGPPIALDAGYTASLAGSSLREILQTGQPRIINDLEAYLELRPESQSTQLILREGIRSSLTCPLIAQGKPVGFLFFSSRQKYAYRIAHQDVFQQIAGQISILIEKTRLYQQVFELNQNLLAARGELEHQARHDVLTGLFNRRAILEHLEAQLARARRLGRSLGVVMLDVDRFKEINDRHGHLIGDATLRGVAARMKDCLREYDYLGRFGGEEFLAVVADANLPDVLEAARRLHHAVGREAIACEGLQLPVTISAGVAVAEDCAEVSVEDIIGLADRALYRAKQNGRNKVESGPALRESAA
jgi:diguanylate cyclase (GGDEF)-like protein